LTAAAHPVEPRLQHKITIALDHQRYKKLEAKLQTAGRARLNSLRVPHAASWLRQPNAKMPRTKPMAARNFELAFRHMLGLAPDDSLPPACVCGSLFKDDPSHFQACTVLRYKPVFDRHSIIVNAIAGLARPLGFTVKKEAPNRRNVPPPEDAVDEPEKGLRADLVLQDDKRTIVMDVSVVHPASKSEALTSSRIPGSAAKRRAQFKITKYGSWVRDEFGNDAGFLPVVFDSFGGCTANGVHQLAKLLAEKAARLGLYAYEEYRLYVIFVLSTALQTGNAIVSKGALRKFLRHPRAFRYNV